MSRLAGQSAWVLLYSGRLIKPKSLVAAVLLGAACLSACSPPKYVNYWSLWRDWRAAVPWGWNIRTDQDGATFASTNLTGPFAPEFYLGVPSIGVRWYQNHGAHRLPDGLVEYYRDGDDFIEQTLTAVYPDSRLVSKKAKEDPEPAEIREVPVAGRKAKNFTVLSEIKAPKDARYGVLVDPATKERGISRLHEYVVLQLKTGFYVIVYPATVRGYDLFKPQFNAFVKSFHVAKEGPAGAAPAAAEPSQPEAEPAARN